MAMLTINLIPERTRRVQRRRQSALRWGIAILVVFVLLAIPLSVDWHDHVKLAGLIQRDNRLELDLSMIRSELQTLTQETKTIDSQTRYAQALRTKRDWSKLLFLIGQSLPRGCWLTSLATDPVKPNRAVLNRHQSSKNKEDDFTLPYLTDSPRRLRISGYAIEASEPHQLVAQLKATDIFTNVALEGMRSETVLEDDYYHFDLICEW